MSEDLQYPIGRFQKPETINAAERMRFIENIRALPSLMRGATQDLTPAQIDTSYRPAGWTVRQVVHHVADSHLNSFIRFKLALTEDAPTIKPYDEALWAELSDVKQTPIETSLVLLEALHQRWLTLLDSLDDNLRARLCIPNAAR